LTSGQAVSLAPAWLGSAFGGKAESTVPPGTYAERNRHRFSTKYLDDEVETVEGTYCYGYRHYLTALGRWVSRDPLGEEGGRNLYGFCYNSAISWYDVLGKQPAGNPPVLGQPDPGAPALGNYAGPGPANTNCASYHMCPQTPAFNPVLPYDPNETPEEFEDRGCRKVSGADDCDKKKEKHVKFYYDVKGGGKLTPVGLLPKKIHALGQTNPGSDTYSHQVGAGNAIYDGVTDPDGAAAQHMKPLGTDPNNIRSIDLCCKCEPDKK